MATSRPLPPMMRPVDFWTTIGSACPNRRRLPSMAAMFSSPWTRAFDGSRWSESSGTRRIARPSCGMGGLLLVQLALGVRLELAYAALGVRLELSELVVL